MNDNLHGRSFALFERRQWLLVGESLMMIFFFFPPQLSVDSHTYALMHPVTHFPLMRFTQQQELSAVPTETKRIYARRDITRPSANLSAAFLDLL